jgi:hypothetical protein
MSTFDPNVRLGAVQTPEDVRFAFDNGAFASSLGLDWLSTQGMLGSAVSEVMENAIGMVPILPR